jgi:serine/threonine protein kinase
LRQEVESLIASHEKSGEFIDAPAYQAAAEIIVDSRAELKPGQTIGSYEIVSFLSRGGMGEVYLAQDRRLSRKGRPQDSSGFIHQRQRSSGPL